LNEELLFELYLILDRTADDVRLHKERPSAPSGSHTRLRNSRAGITKVIWEQQSAIEKHKQKHAHSPILVMFSIW